LWAFFSFFLAIANFYREIRGVPLPLSVKKVQSQSMFHLLLLRGACIDEPEMASMSPLALPPEPVAVHVEQGESPSCTADEPGLAEFHFRPTEPALASAGMAVGDLDGEGWLDIFVPNRNGNQLLLGNSERLEDHSDRLLVVDIHAESASMADFDADGDLDIFVGTDRKSYMLVNDGTTHFPEYFAVSDEHAATFGGTWGDVDADGDLDLLVCNRSLYSPPPSVVAAGDAPPGDGSWLLLSDGKGGFEDVRDRIAAVKELYPNTCLMQDLDDDRDLDLYFVNDFGPWIGPNRVLWNDGTGFFAEDQDSGLEVEIQGMGVAVASMDGGPIPSLLLSSWDEMKFLEPIEGGWVDSTLARGFELADDQQVAWGVAMPDLNNDGQMDAAVTFGNIQGEEPREDDDQGGNGQGQNNQGQGDQGQDDQGHGGYSEEGDNEGFEDLGYLNPEDQSDAIFLNTNDGFVQSEEWPLPDPSSGRGLVSADIDRNGSMDLVVHSLDDGLHVYMNDCPTQHWTRVLLQQPGLNRQAIGARVEVVAGGQRQVQWVHGGGTSYASSGPAEVQFGLGGAEEIEEIRVIWPDGAFSLVESQPVDRELKILRD
jgi:enediyne biosynthesis protein E4